MVRLRSSVYMLLILLVYPCMALSFEDNKTVFVRNVSSYVIDSTQAVGISNMLAAELSTYSRWQIITYDDVVQMIDQEQQKELLDCKSESCMQQIAENLGAPYMVRGDISKIGELFVCNLSLIDTEKAKSIRKVSHKAKSINTLLEEITTIAKRLIGITGTQEVIGSAYWDFVHKKAVFFNSVPPNATVIINGKEIENKTPCVHLLSKGSHKVEFQLPFHKSFTSVIQVQSDWQNIPGTLKPIQESYRGAGSSKKYRADLAQKRYGMKAIPQGEFIMGHAKHTNVIRPHGVIVDGFYMDSTEVTQNEYKRLIKRNPACFKGGDNPVDSVSWYDAALYCNERSKEAGFDTVYSYTGVKRLSYKRYKLLNIHIRYEANGFRLPTEAEWEYACRGGTTTEYFWGDSAIGWHEYANLSDHAMNVKAKTKGITDGVDEYKRKGSTAVASYKPNNFGLYDLIGNVSEWCNDIHEQKPRFDAGSYTANPRGPQKIDLTIYRVIRGEYWRSGAAYSAFRYRKNSSSPDSLTGFRVVLPQ